MKYVIGTRGSRLALVQSEMVKKQLEVHYPEHEFELKIIKTKGDLIQDRPLNKIGDKGLFVKEIEEEILSGTVHIGVHSMKDMPAVPAPGLKFTKCWKREDPRDVLILREKKCLNDLPFGAVIGTGSKRRKYQLLKLRPDLKIVDIRGNVDTRLHKMETEKLDGIILAAAGLHRLGMEDVITEYLSSSQMISAPGQGILALEIRDGEKEIERMLDALYDETTHQQAIAERSYLELIHGDCHVPIGAVCEKVSEDEYELRCMFGNEDGKKTAYSVKRGTDPLKLAESCVRTIRRQMSGLVSLVGAGPGDPGLITVKGMQAIREADCIIYDRLSTPKLLEEAKVDCELIYAGKANRYHTMKQDEINELLVEKALQYNRVVRLKGGDVYVFGRGGEEGIYLKDHDISFEIIPGVSSALAGLAYAGIPITHRGIATGFRVVTAHNRRDELADIDFASMVDSKDTCVFLMGLSKLQEIVNGLLNAGMNPQTKIAVIQSATTNAQKTVIARLDQIVDEVQKVKLESPALIVVGDVVDLRDKLKFYEDKPLFGKNYLVPKIGEKVSALKEKLEQAGAAAREIQVGSIERIPVKFEKEELNSVNWLIFTSKNGVKEFFTNVFESELDIRDLAKTKIAVIGSQTGESLKQYGLRADLIPGVFYSGKLREIMKEEMHPTDIVWYPMAKNADDSMKEFFQDICQFKELPVYENVEVSIPQIKDLNSYDGVFFTCASSAQRFFANVDAVNLKDTCELYSIGIKSSEALESLGLKNIVQAEKATYDSLVKTVKERVLSAQE